MEFDYAETRIPEHKIICFLGIGKEESRPVQVIYIAIKIKLTTLIMKLYMEVGR